MKINVINELLANGLLDKYSNNNLNKIPLNNKHKRFSYEKNEKKITNKKEKDCLLMTMMQDQYGN